MGKILNFLKGTFLGTWLRKWIVKKTFNLLEEEYIPDISHPILRKVAMDQVDRAETAVKILIDDNPDDPEQFRQYWKMHRKDFLCDGLEYVDMIGDIYIDSDTLKDYFKSGINEAKEAAKCGQ